jgi:flagellar biosynthesis protein FlhA
MTPTLRVFLCHGKEDKPKVRQLYRQLVEYGLDPWLDEEKLRGGQDWEIEIRKAVRTCDVVLACLSRSSISRAGYIQKEIRFALDVADEQPEGAAYLIPVRFDDCDIPERLKRWQWVNLFEPQGTDKLFEALRERWHSLPKATATADGNVAAKQREWALTGIDAIAIEIGFSLVSLVTGGKDSPLIRRTVAIRRQIASEFGYVCPAIRVRDDLRLRAHQYRILLKGAEVSRFELKKDCELAIAGSGALAAIEGTPVREPAFSLPAFWINPGQVDVVGRAGYVVVDHVSVVGTHLATILRRHLWEIFSIDDANAFLDECRETNPLTVEALVPGLTLPAVHAVLRNLLKEMVPINDRVTIVETLVRAASVTRDPVALTEDVRKALRFSIIRRLLQSDGALHVFFLDPAIERDIAASVDAATGRAALPSDIGRRIIEQIAAAVTPNEAEPVILTAAPLRYVLKQLIDRDLPDVRVLSRDEVPSEIQLDSKGQIG